MILNMKRKFCLSIAFMCNPCNCHVVEIIFVANSFYEYGDPRTQCLPINFQSNAYKRIQTELISDF